MKRSLFTKDKNALLKRLTRFDGANEVEDVIGAVKQRKYSHHDTFLIQVLLEQVCQAIEPDDRKRMVLFETVCRKLKFIDDSDLNKFMPKRRYFAEKFVQIVKLIRAQVISTQGEITYDLPGSDCFQFSKIFETQNRYDQIFEHLETIAEGGYGVVSKVRNKVDGIIYAVKKIVFKYKNDSVYLRVIREAKNIAALKHPNVVSYNTAWIENPSISEVLFERANKTKLSDSSSSQESSSSEASCDVIDNEDTSLKANQSSDSCSQENSSSEASCDVIDNEDTPLKANQSSDSIIFEDEDNNDSSVRSGLCYGYVENPSGLWFKDQGSQKDIRVEEPCDALKSLCGKDGAFPDNLTENMNSIILNKTSDYMLADFSSSAFAKNHRLTRDYHQSSCDNDLMNSRDLLPNLPNFKWSLANLNIKVMLCIQMEFCDCDLRLWLDQRAKGEPLAFEMDVNRIFKDILNGVAYIHSKSIIHRDLKPKNIFYSKENGVMKIGDFGLATLVNCTDVGISDGFAGNLSANLGTIPYAAPEQRSLKKYDYKADIYSLGIILIELLIVFQTRMEFAKMVDEIVKGCFPESMLDDWPLHIELLKALVKKKPEERLTAEEILLLPILKENQKYMDEVSQFEYENRIAEMQREIESLKLELKRKDKVILELQQSKIND